MRALFDRGRKATSLDPIGALPYEYRNSTDAASPELDDARLAHQSAIK